MQSWGFVKFSPPNVEISEDDDWYEFWNIDDEECYSECSWQEMSYNKYHKKDKITFLFDEYSNGGW